MNDSITIKWHIDDVKSLNESLTNEQCREVLQRAKSNHDATIGISWDVLQVYINELD